MGGKVFGKVAGSLERDSKREGGGSAIIGLDLLCLRVKVGKICVG